MPPGKNDKCAICRTPQLKRLGHKLQSSVNVPRTVGGPSPRPCLTQLLDRNDVRWGMPLADLQGYMPHDEWLCRARRCVQFNQHPR